MMKQTANLRFIKRQVGKDVCRVLQQQWIDDDPPDEGASRYVWRDIPTSDENDEDPPPQVDSGRGPTAEDIYACAKSTLIGFRDELTEDQIKFICDQISRKASVT